MAKSSEPGMYSLPFEIQRMYHHLMNSKEEFSKRLTPAENRWLGTLYEQLTAAWNRNHIDELKKALEQSYQELRRIQSELGKNSEEVEKSIEEELKRDLQQRSKDLKQKRRYYEKLSTNLKSDVQTWKVDIKQRELNLNQRRAKYEASKSERSSAQKTLQQMRDTLNVLSSRYERISTANSKKADDYSARMQALRSANDKELNPRIDGLLQRRRSLQEKKEAFQRGLRNKSWPDLPSIADMSEKERLASENLKRAQEWNRKVLEEERNRLSESLKKDEHDLLEKAWSKWIDQQPNLSPESKRYLTLEGRSLGMMKIKRNISGLKEHAGALRRALTKAGINHDEFLTQYDAHCASEQMPAP